MRFKEWNPRNAAAEGAEERFQQICEEWRIDIEQIRDGNVALLDSDGDDLPDLEAARYEIAHLMVLFNLLSEHHTELMKRISLAATALLGLVHVSVPSDDFDAADEIDDDEP